MILTDLFTPVKKVLRGRRPQNQRAEMIVNAMRAAVDAAGARHRSDTVSTWHEDKSGFACIQGEMMRQMGINISLRASAGYHTRVAIMIDPLHEVRGLEAALRHAQVANDDNEQWGRILRRFEWALAA